MRRDARRIRLFFLPFSRPAGQCRVHVMDRLLPADRIDETLIRVEWPDPLGKYPQQPADKLSLSLSLLCTRWMRIILSLSLSRSLSGLSMSARLIERCLPLTRIYAAALTADFESSRLVERTNGFFLPLMLTRIVAPLLRLRDIYI